jgi:hypothetical protein
MSTFTATLWQAPAKRSANLDPGRGEFAVAAVAKATSDASFESRRARPASLNTEGELAALLSKLKADG